MDTPNPTTLAVVQYNILADALCVDPDAGFTSLPPDQLEWSIRGPAIVAALLKAEADVMCVQEADHYHDTLAPALSAAGYAGCYREDEWSPCRKLGDGSLRDGVAIFYRREKLELLGSHVPCIPRRSKEVDAAADGTMQDAGKCLMARFRVVGTMEEVVVATVHLDSKKTEAGVAKRHRQATRCARAIQAFREFSCVNPSAAMVIVAGDLNAQPHEPAVGVFKHPPAPTCEGDSSSGLPKMVSAYEAASSSTPPAEPPFTTWKIRSGPFKPGEAKMTIDYIFVSEACDVVDVAPLDDEAAIGAKGLPCEAHPSDHLMLRATVRWRPHTRWRCTSALI